MAAGGVTSGRVLAAVLAAGAEGVWAGTVFLAAVEAAYQPGLREAILASDGQDTIRSKALDVLFDALGPGRPAWPVGVALRSRRNTVTDRWHGREAELAANTEVVAGYIDQLKHNDPDVFPWLYGEGAGSVTVTMTVQEIINTLFTDALDRLRDLATPLGR